MTVTHHRLAHVVTDSILKKFKEEKWSIEIPSEDSKGKKIGSDFLRDSVESSHPSPDAAFYDEGNKIRVAFEFKPEYSENKRGILTGLGQSIAYLTLEYSASYLIVPNTLKGFDLEEYMKDVLKSLVGKLPVGLITYDNNDPSKVSLIHNIKNQKLEEIKGRKVSRYWAKHQDQPIALFHLILHYYYLKFQDREYENAFEKCWEESLIGDSLETLVPIVVKDIRGEKIINFDGTVKQYLSKTIKKINKIENQDKKNEEIVELKKKNKRDATKIRKNLIKFHNHIGTIDAMGEDGSLTEEGIKLYNLGLIHGPTSTMFKNYFLKYLLLKGHHLELIFDLQNIYDKYRGLKTSKEIREIMEKEYGEKGYIERNEARNKKTHIEDDGEVEKLQGKWKCKTCDKEFGKTVKDLKNSIEDGEIELHDSKVEWLKFEEIVWKGLGIQKQKKDEWKVLGIQKQKKDVWVKPDRYFDWKKISEIIQLPEL